MTTGVIIGGAVVPLPGRRVVTWKDDKRLRLSREDGRKRSTSWIRQVILHTTKGIPGGADRRPQLILQGRGVATDAGARTSAWWSKDPKSSGAHFVVDHDTTIAQLADAASEVAFHAGPVNEWSVGIEIYQGASAELYTEQLLAAADLVDLLTLAFGIQRQIPDTYRGGPLRRLESGGHNVVGVFGHRDVTSNRGLGDPGDAVMAVLARRAYRRFNFPGLEDVAAWQAIQTSIGLMPDGIPGPRTVAALRQRGFGGGLFALPPAEDARNA